MTQQLELDLWRESPPPAPAPTRAATSPGATPEPLALARRQARALARSLSVALGVPVRLALTDNRRTMLSSRRDGSTWIIRAHHLFLEAGEAVAQAMARYLRDGDARAGATIDAFIAEQQAAVVASRRRSTVLVTAGRHHDLRTIFDDLALRCFRVPFDAQITWSPPRRARGRQRSIQLGVYLSEQQLIRINPILDQAWVPRFYVETIVHHEMLHHEVPGVVVNGRRRVHTPRFQALERAFEHYDDARSWEALNLRRLLQGDTA